MPAAIIPILLIASAAASAYSTVQQGKQAKAQANYQAAVDENNATKKGYEQIAYAQGAAREGSHIADQRDRVLHEQINSAAGSGLMISGSVHDVMSDSAIQAQKDIDMAHYRGSVGSYNAQSEGADLMVSSTMTRLAGKNAQTASWFEAGATLAKGAAGAYGSYTSAKTPATSLGSYKSYNTAGVGK